MSSFFNYLCMCPYDGEIREISTSWKIELGGWIDGSSGDPEDNYQVIQDLN